MERKRAKRKQPNGAGSVTWNATTSRWVARATLTDEAGRKVRKCWYGQSAQEARAKMVEGMAAHSAGTLAVVPGRAVTVEAWCRSWLGTLDVRPTTARRYELAVEKHIRPGLGGVQLPRLSVRQVNAFLRDRREAGLAPATVANLKTILGMALQAAISEGLLARNVARQANRVKRRQLERPVLAPEHVPAFLAMADAHDDGPLWIVLLSTGLRLGEAQGLTWSDVDLEAGVLAVRRSLARDGGRWIVQQPKTARSARRIKIPETARAALQRQRDRGVEGIAPWTGYVFLTRAGVPSVPTTLPGRFHDALELAGLPRLRLHDLRHSAASVMLAAGIPLPVVSAQLGHADTDVTGRVYAHQLREFSIAAADAMDSALSPMRIVP